MKRKRLINFDFSKFDVSNKNVWFFKYVFSNIDLIYAKWICGWKEGRWQIFKTLSLIEDRFDEQALNYKTMANWRANIAQCCVIIETAQVSPSCWRCQYKQIKLAVYLWTKEQQNWIFHTSKLILGERTLHPLLFLPFSCEFFLKSSHV